MPLVVSKLTRMPWVPPPWTYAEQNALVTDEAANLDVLLDDQDQVLQSLVHGLAVLGLASHQSLNISRFCFMMT